MAGASASAAGNGGAAGVGEPIGGGAALGGFGGAAGTMTAPPRPQSATVLDQCGADNPAGLSPQDVQALMTASASAAGMRWLYPYNETVFPRGMLAPLFMWEGGPAADAVYLHIVSGSFEYKGCLRPTAAGQLQVPQDAWDAAGDHTGGAADPYRIELSILSAGSASGPVAQTIEIAPATIKGSIYYNSYSSKLDAPPSTEPPMMNMWGVPTTGTWPGAGSGGMILRIPPKQSAQVFVSTGCTGCHSVSANGSRLLSQSTMGGTSFQLTPTTAPNPPSQMAGSKACFGALYPDGSVYLSSAASTDLAHCGGGNVQASLVFTDNGSVVMGASFPSVAMMPTFSPDGSKLVWVDSASPMNIGIAEWDHATNAASAQRNVFTSNDPAQKPAWPFVLPDNQAVIFLRTNSPDYSGMGAGIGGSMSPNGELYITDLQSGTTTLLARAMGFASEGGANELPFGEAEAHKSFFPTVSPVAAGGYFWVFFDSLRHYGNLGLQRQLWGFAIRVSADGNYASDPSRPAFYVSGQEFGTGNHRAFTALDPCVEAGATCTSGVDCCGGFCTVAENGAGTCGMPNEPRCSQTDEACTSKADCCDPSDSCIAGYCGLIIVQ